jgi:hypothetical protein
MGSGQVILVISVVLLALGLAVVYYLSTASSAKTTTVTGTWNASFPAPVASKLQICKTGKVIVISGPDFPVNGTTVNADSAAVFSTALPVEYRPTTVTHVMISVNGWRPIPGRLVIDKTGQLTLAPINDQMKFGGGNTISWSAWSATYLV